MIKLALGIETVIGRSTVGCDFPPFFPTTKGVSRNSEVLRGWTDRKPLRGRFKCMHIYACFKDGLKLLFASFAYI